MNDERIVSFIGRASTTTMEFLLKFLYLSMVKSADIVTHHQATRSFTGEVGWEKFLRTHGQKDIQEFLPNEVNLSAFKEELKRYKIGFAFTQNSDGTMALAYDFKNKKVVEKALEKVIAKIQDNPEAFKKTLHQMTPAEKIKHHATKQEKHRVGPQMNTPKLSSSMDKGGIAK